MKKYITAGLAVRREIRRWLLGEGIEFYEEKGWIDSVFYLKCSDETYRRIVNALNKWEESFTPHHQ